jgi:outer membrane protein TolC
MKTNKIGILILIIISLFLPFTVLAAEIEFTEAVEIGLENNDTLSDLESQIKAQKRAIKILEAGNNFQLSLEAADSELSESDTESLGLSLSKDYSFGLSITPGLEETTVDIDTEDFSSEYYLEVSQQLFPWVPNDNAQERYAAERELEKYYEQLVTQRNSKVIEWVESYLNLLRLNEDIELYQKELELTKKELKDVKDKSTLNEASNLELMASELSYKEAKLKYDSAKKNFQENREDLKIELGLADEDEIILTEKSNFINKMKSKVEQFNFKAVATEELVAKAVENDYDLKSAEIERKKLKQQLEWTEKDGNTELSLVGNYTSADDDFTLGITLSHVLYDGGEHKLEIEDKEAEIEDINSDYQRLLKELKLEIKEKKNNLSTSQSSLENSEISYQRAVINSKIAAQEFENGVITELEYKEYQNSQMEAEINLKAAEDSLLVAKLNFLSLISKNEIQAVIKRD